MIICQDDYPTVAPIWFTESDDENLTQIVESLSTANGEDNLIINQVKKLITKLCQIKNTPLPEFSQLEAAGSSNGVKLKLFLKKYYIFQFLI